MKYLHNMLWEMLFGDTPTTSPKITYRSDTARTMYSLHVNVANQATVKATYQADGRMKTTDVIVKAMAHGSEWRDHVHWFFDVVQADLNGIPLPR